MLKLSSDKHFSFQGILFIAKLQLLFSTKHSVARKYFYTNWP